MKKSKFIIFIVAVIVLVVGLGIVANKGSSAPGKYDAFAQALKSEGAHFYGAFWCPHCADQEKALDSTRQKLESIGLYTECSNPDKSPTQACTDAKIESFPTWMFKDGITLNSTNQPTVCSMNPDSTALAKEAPLCAQISSAYFKVYYFPEYQFSIRTPVDPTEKDGVWKFPAEASTTGLVPLPFLAQQINFTLPQ